MYRKIPLNEAIKIDYIYTIHNFEFTKDFAYTGEKHNFWKLVYIDKGDVGILADNQRYTLSQGEIIFHKPNEFHNIWSKDYAAKIISITFDCSSVAMKFFENKILFLNQKNSSLLTDIIDEAKTTFTEPLNILGISRMTENKQYPFASKQIIKLRLEELLICLIRMNNTIKTKDRIVSYARENRNHELVQQINNYLNENIYKNITLDMVCSKFSFSKTYVKKVYKNVTGTSIIDYFINLKIEEAKKMLNEDKYNISEVAELLAFNSVHYFSRCFKKRTNMTPSEFARSVKTN